jgi:pyrimidine operon attenuation protein/uracil phosphoribosyltransferase
VQAGRCPAAVWPLAGRPDCHTMPRTRRKPLADHQEHASRKILDASQIERVVRRMAGEIVEKNQGTRDVMLVGIRTRGVPLAEGLAAEIERMEGHAVARGTLDITLYRDDLSTIGPQPIVRPTSFEQPIDDKVVILCDDVLYTGRTVRAALDALIDYGRPRAVRLAVLVDRGHRELPIQADFVGQVVQTADDDVIKVAFEETDGRQEVLLIHGFKAK